jgi:dienelactone hydrolase
VPAIVILHGSGGISEGREYEYAQLFTQNGIAAFVVDYYAPRGVTEQTPYVMKTMAATEVDIMSDAYSALKILGTHPAIDAERIGVTGYSYGGMATRYVLDDRLKNIMAPDVPSFALHMDIYGPCHQTLGHKGTTGAPYLAIHGDADNSVDPALCQEVYKDLEAAGSQVESHVIAGAGHAWENYAPLSEFEGSFVRGCKFSFDENGTFLVNGKSGRFQPTPEMTRPQRAMVRAGLGELAGSCVGQGYTVGNNPEADKQSKAIQVEFMKRVFGL